MCGVYGVASQIEIPEEVKIKFSNLGTAIGHRGPDGTTENLEENFATGFCRLSIVDVANGMQPFYSEDKSISVTGNGEIYNYRELQDEVIAAGHILSTDSDFEVIPHLYEIYGDDFVHKLRGMFVVVLIDKKTDKLKIYVDRLGEKPIYWSRKDQFFIYSSEIVPLLKSKLVEMILETKQVPAYIKYGFTLDPYTFVQNVYRVSGGTFLTYSIQDNSLKQTKYWDCSDTSSIIFNPVTELNSQIQDIAKFIGQGEVKLGLALSGGSDSKLLGNVMKSNYPELESITVGYQEISNYDESKSAMEFANKIGMRNYTSRVSKGDVPKLFKEACLALDEPVSDIAAISYLEIFKRAQNENIKVLVSGHGADEFFFGYAWLILAIRQAEVRAETLSGNFRILNYFELLPRINIVSFLSVKEIFEFTKKFHSVFRQCFSDLLDARKKIQTVDFFNLSYAHREKSYLAKKLNSALNESVDFEKVYPIMAKNKFADLARSQIIKDYLRVNGFMQIDKLSMKCSIEARNPLADYKLLQIATSSKWDPLTTPLKSQLRMHIINYFDPYTDDYLKQGFSPPTRSWYKEIQKNLISELNNPRIIEMKLLPKKWKKYIKKPFRWYGAKSEVWFPLIVLEIWVREVERLVGDKFIATSGYE